MPLMMTGTPGLPGMTIAGQSAACAGSATQNPSPITTHARARIAKLRAASGRRNLAHHAREW